MQVDWKEIYAAIYRAKKEVLKPVKDLDEVTLNSLIGIDKQKEEIVENTKRFLNDFPSNNVLLWGARGTGKSSLIKAILNEFKDDGLRIIEIDREDLDDLIEISDILRDEPYKFIIFCDDLSFEEGEKGYKGLKRVLEGSIEKTPKNIKIYATSNRRHLITEYHKDNFGTKVGDNGEIHYSDSVEEKISLSDRFGLQLGFYHGTQQEYLDVVNSYFPNFSGDIDALHKQALQFAQRRGSKSARTAKQFFNSISKEVIN